MIPIILLPPDVSEVAFIALAVISFLGSFITVALGIGGGGLVLAVMANLVPPLALIPVHGVIQLGSNAGRLAMFFRDVHWVALPAFAIGTLVGATVGGLIAVDLPPAYVEIGVGAFVVFTVFARSPKWLSRWPAIAGVLSSFLTMFFGATGLFVASFTKSLALDRHSHVATHAAVMTLQHGLKVVIFGLLGFAFAPWVFTIAAMIATGFLGTYVGKHALAKMSDRNFKLALNVVLVLISLRLIWSGLGELRS
ncbi:MAG: sulfite exporter TauE/SafE family protein [Boseongicola sp.]|nr:sulfite exporter TauE/SafE family protein [Boseongicola sp.]